METILIMTWKWIGSDELQGSSELSNRYLLRLEARKRALQKPIA